MEITITDAFEILEMTLDSLDAPFVAKEALTFIHEIYNKLSGNDESRWDVDSHDESCPCVPYGDEMTE